MNSLEPKKNTPLQSNDTGSFWFVRIFYTPASKEKKFINRHIKLFGNGFLDRLGLSEEELLDLLEKLLEIEQIKRRRRPAPHLESAVRAILKKEVPPENTEERRKCMIELSDILKMKSRDEAGRRD